MSWVEAKALAIAADQRLSRLSAVEFSLRMAVEEAARRVAIEIPVTGRPGYADRAHANILAMLVDTGPQQPEVKR